MKRVQDQRIWLAGGALIALVVVAISWLVLIGPKLSSASDLDDQALMSRQQNEALQTRTDSLKAKSTQLSRYTSSLTAALASLPYDSGLPAFTRQLDAQAKAEGVTVDSLAVGAVVPVETAAPAATTSGDAGTSGTPAPAPAATGGMFSMQATVLSSGPLRRQLAFIRMIRTVGPRQVLITGVQVTPGTGAKANSVDRAAALTTQMTIFVAPKTTAQIRQLNKLASGDLGR